jgi:hypothetical protein
VDQPSTLDYYGQTLTTQPVPRDGSCMFHAVFFALFGWLPVSPYIPSYVIWSRIQGHWDCVR